MRDDILPTENPVVQEAMNRLSEKEAFDRTFRLRRAVQLHMTHQTLPEHEQISQKDDVPYLWNKIMEVCKEQDEKEAFDSLVPTETTLKKMLNEKTAQQEQQAAQRASKDGPQRKMQGGLQRGRRPYYGNNGNGGYRGGQERRGPYDRPSSGRQFREAVGNIPRIRTVKEAMETNVLLTKDQYYTMDDVSVADLSEEEKLRAFNEYVESHRRAALERFFLGHKDEAWFTDRYLGDEFEVETAMVGERFQQFVEDFKAGKLASLQLGYGDDLSISEDQDSAEVKNIPLSSKLPERLAEAVIERHSDVLAIGNIPTSVTKASIEALLRDSSDDQFICLYVSEPIYEKSLYRNGYAVFKEGTDLNSLTLKLENVLVEGAKIYYSIQKSFTRQIRLLPSEFSTAERMAVDAELSSRLLRTVLEHYGLGEIPWTTETNLLDLNVTCLRRVFSICYYNGASCGNPLELFKQFGDLVLRVPASGTETTSQSSLDPRIEDLIRLFGPGFQLATEDNIVESKYVIKLDESRFRCSLCSKLFKGPEFVIKHVRLKHEEESNVALQQLSLLNLFLARPSMCAFLKSTVLIRRPSVSRHQQQHQVESRLAERRPPPPDADTKVMKRPVRQYTDWDAPATGEVEINYD